MEVTGVVVAASEKISMQQFIGLLLMLYNTDMDLHFCILVYHEVMTVWKNIHVNQCYKFLDLKVGVLQTSLGGKICLLKTTETSAFSVIDSLQIEKFHVQESLKYLISFPGIIGSVPSSSLSGSNLVSYQGIITKLKNTEIGIYELDSKVLLYTTFNTSCVMLTEGSEVIISNAHLIKDYMDAPILVCCGLSCVKSSKPSHINEKSGFVPNEENLGNFCIQYGLNIFDLLWFERLLSRLKKKFRSLMTDEEILFKQDSSFLRNTLEYFLFVENETNKKLSLVEEFISSPHWCLPFLESRLPTECRVPYLSRILDEVVENASWMDAGARWKFCIGRQDNSVIIGILYVSNSGSLYIADGTAKLPVIIAGDCDNCCHDDHNILKELRNSKCASVVAIQDYDIIVENIFFANRNRQSIRYLRTSFCRLYSLFSLRKSPADDSFTFQIASRESESHVENVSYLHGNSEKIRHRFLVLSRIWTLRNKIPFCSRVLVLFLSEVDGNEIGQDGRVFDSESESDLSDTFNFYDSGDDVEFSHLISKLNLLHIDDEEVKMGYLCFEDTHQNRVLFPGHIYSIAAKDTNKISGLTFEDSGHRIFTWTVTPDIVIDHDAVCKGDHFLEDVGDVEIHGIKEILSKRQLNRNWIVNCILQDKTYVDLENTNEGKAASPTLCLTVKDATSEECSVKVYVPQFSGSVQGLLPGAPLQLFGFLCFRSQGGGLYLKSTSVFGVLVKPSPRTPSGKCRSASSCGFPEGEHSVSSPLLSGNSFHTPVQSICFVVKITSAEIFLACGRCGKNLNERCSCCSPHKIKVRLSAQIDDGAQLLLAHCSDGAARKVLRMDPDEWRALASYVQLSHRSLAFSERAFWSKSALLPVMSQVFSAYCSSPATSRKLLFEYIYVPRARATPKDLPSVCCRSAEEVDSQKHAMKLYLKLRNAGRSPPGELH